MIALFLALVLQDGFEAPTGRPASSIGVTVPKAVRTAGEDRTFHPVTIEKLPASKWTHVRVCGLVTLVKREADHDVHLRLSGDGGAFIVGEIIPAVPLATPRGGQRICLDGISREDKAHRWYEVHPVLRWRLQ